MVKNLLCNRHSARLIKNNNVSIICRLPGKMQGAFRNVINITGAINFGLAFDDKLTLTFEHNPK